MSARVFVADTFVGLLTPNPAAGTAELDIDPSYATNGSRPVLGRWFEEFDLSRRHRFRGAPLPNFFRNLLPEGALKKVVLDRLGATSLPEYSMLLRLGMDLPGAVRVQADSIEEGPLEEQEQRTRTARDPFRFALTGVQPKLSIFAAHERLTVPVEGESGFWIAKFGTPAFNQLVENEHTLLRWAARCGLDVPEHRVIRADQIERLPEGFDPTQPVLLVRRFDRGEDGARIHQEDFAQVFDLAPEQKYPSEHLELDWLHFGTACDFVHRLCGFDDLVALTKRLAFMILSGNDDAHLKNWALVYPDGIHARLAPVYDIVATVAYGGRSKAAAMRWSRPAAPTLDPGEPLVDVKVDHLLAAVSCAEGADTGRVLDELERFIPRVREEWKILEPETTPFVRKAVSTHLAASQLR